MFFKVVHHNARERRREVLLMAVFEDQIPKWENCLEPTDEIKAYDRTYKLINDRLLKAVIERSKKLNSTAGHNNKHFDSDDDGDQEW